MANPTTESLTNLAEGPLSGLGDLVWYAVVIGAIFAVAFALTTWLTRAQSELKGTRRAFERLIPWLPLMQLGVWIVATLLAAGVLMRAPTAVILFVLVPAIVALVVGSRDLVRNVFAGAVLAIERSILVGDVIRLEGPDDRGVRGEVRALGIRRTRLERDDGTAVLLPNHHLLNSTVHTNRSHQRDSAVEIDVPMPGDPDSEMLDEIRSVALEAARVSRFASPRRRPEIFLESGDDGRLRLRLTAYAFAPGYVRHLESDVLDIIRENTPRDVHST